MGFGPNHNEIKDGGEREGGMKGTEKYQIFKPQELRIIMNLFQMI